MQLFRQQALEAQSNRLHGDILLLPRLSHGVLLVLALLWFGAALYWFTHSSYARKETVRGWLQPSSGVTRVYSASEGIVKQVLVTNGDSVSKGQALVVINGDRVLASGENLEGLLLAEYAKQQAALQVQLDRNQIIFGQRRRDIQQQLTAAQQDLDLLQQQLATLDQRRRLLSSQLSRFRALNRAGHVAATELEATQSRELALRSDRQTLMRSQVNQRNTIERLQIAALLLPQEQANTSDSLGVKLSGIAQHIARLHGQRASIVTAPRAGVVHNLQTSRGQQVPGSSIPLLTIVPADATLTVQLLVPVRAAGFLETGQTLHIRYDAFPYQKFGLYSGEITQVSEFIQLPHETLESPIALQEAVYRVSAALASPAVTAFGRSFALKPGMTLSADILLSDRSLFQWLLEPIHSLRGRL